MKIIPLTQGKSVLVSDEDFEYLNQWKWCVSHYGYAVRSCRRPNGKKGILWMHRALMERMLNEPIPDGYQVDHIDSNSLNNQRGNLRLATKSQNQMNRQNKKRAGNTSRFKGVCYARRERVWRAETKLKGKRINIGSFDSEEDAARAYDAVARELFGEYARLNFPDECAPMPAKRQRS